MPPKNCEWPTRSTPGTASICASRRIGSGLVKLVRDWVISRFAPRKSAPPASTEFTACSRPISRKAAPSESRVKPVRVLRRISAPQTSGRYFSAMAAGP
ncbi:hypothetical protein [Alkalisalibacterium limincola]|uniref:hypothetical protein n=1 Tax=Alkalisalibacterium limincola TaxID=2699169 RepID=UPI002105BD7A|nr:hypothetical protein [Alkalisalibacterium limincola]